MFSTGQTAVVGVGLVMAAALGFTSAKALSQERAEPVTAAPSPAASASASGKADPAQASEKASKQRAGAGGCAAEVVIQDRWPGGYKAEIRITNHGERAAEDWVATFRMPKGSTLDGTWNADFDQDGATVTAEAPDWGRDLAPGKTAAFGFTASGKPSPGHVAVNGASCT